MKADNQDTLHQGANHGCSASLKIYSRSAERAAEYHPFIAGNLALGVTFSTVSANQMQATQLAQMTLMPAFILSGFMFPFRGMPVWAQWIGNIFPITHAMRIVRALLLKGVGWSDIAPEIWPMALFAVAVVGFATLAYRETLD